MKTTFLLFSLITISFFANSQKMDSTALIIIDIQDFYFPGGAAELVEPEKAAEQAKILINHFRENKGLVVHVKHDFSPGGEIHQLVKPLDNEKVFTKKEVNAFLNTGLNETLKQNHIKYLVLSGMQTHMCLEAATRAAHDFGYNCTIVEDACATKDLSFKGKTIKASDVHASFMAALSVPYAQVMTTSETLKNMS